MNQPIEFAYFGTPYVARDTLATLVERGFTPAVVITSPDAPRGRGLVLTPSETKSWALAHDIPVLTPEKLDADTNEEIKKYDCELGIVVAYGKILPQSLIDAFPKGILNIHYSLLPKYRGASPVESALLHDEKTTGITIQKMAFELDAGDVLAQTEVPIEPAETTRELRARLIKLGAELLSDILPRYVTSELVGVPQDATQATRAKKIKKEEGELTIPGNNRENWNKYRAYAEWPGTHFFRDGKRVKITKARFENDAFVIEHVVPEGKNEMDYADFLRK